LVREIRVGRMSSKGDVSRVFEHIAKPGDRSSLFWWMLEHHDEIVAAKAGRRIRWKQFCADVTALGIGDTRGKPVSERNARETWWQVRREKERLEKAKVEQERAKAAAAEVRLHYPSRQPKDWRPEVVASDGGGARRSMVPVKRVEGDGVRAKVEAWVTELSSAEYQRLRDERGEDGLLTDRAMAIRDREVKLNHRKMDEWMGHRHRDEED
jgi:hypothetical protein